MIPAFANPPRCYVKATCASDIQQPMSFALQQVEPLITRAHEQVEQQNERPGHPDAALA